MFEELIGGLDSLGVSYEETPDGTLVINVADIDKVSLINVIQLANDTGMEFTIDEMSLTVFGGDLVEPMEEPEEPIDAQAQALKEFM